MDKRVELRRALSAYLGAEQFRKFVAQGLRNGRLRYWQEECWKRFIESNPNFATCFEDLPAAIRICELHGGDLMPDTLPVTHGCLDYTQEFTNAMSKSFPNAAIWPVMVGTDFLGDTIDVWYCTACRTA